MFSFFFFLALSQVHQKDVESWIQFLTKEISDIEIDDSNLFVSSFFTLQKVGQLIDTACFIQLWSWDFERHVHLTWKQPSYKNYSTAWKSVIVQTQIEEDLYACKE